MKQKIRNTILATSVLALFVVPIVASPTVSALECSIIPKQFCVEGGSGNDSGIMQLLKLGIMVLTGLVGVAAVAAVVYAGIMYASAGDKADQVSKAKNMITQTVIGIILYALMFFAIQWLVPGGIV